MKKFFKTLIVLTGTSLGFAVARLIVDIIQTYYADIVQDQGYWIRPALYAGLMIVGTLVFLIFSEKWASGLVRFISDTEEGISKASYRTVLFNTAGIAIGIIIAFFFSHIVSRLGEGPFVFFIDIIIYVVFVYLSVIVATKLSKAKRKNIMSDAEDEEMERKPETYFVDTSSLIDGRIYDFLSTGVIEGNIIIPGFILSELQNIADSEDDLRREKGRRGLDILNRMVSSFNEAPLVAKVENHKPYDRNNIDLSLVNLAEQNRGRIITLDFNLNKVATANGLKVININDISNSLKMSLIPGDRIDVTIIKRGKERQQGIGYLEDGTMIVVEDTASRIGETLRAEITSSLQTSAGRMIFARMVR
ncbi:MAG: TRAM domain-containing protein [Clostridia bacterium]|nr:TRAM domain-containing protein [Clostridia bacterium]